MDNFGAHLNIVRRISFLCLSACFLLWALLPQYKAYFAGLIIGITVSLINALHLAWKVRKVGHAAEHKTNRRVNLGFLTRASLALLAIIVALRYDAAEFSTTLAGLFFAQLIAIAVGVVHVLRNNK